jgi:hypothetical protein
MTHILHWIKLHESTFWWWGGISVVMFLGTILVVPFLVARIPADYFVRPRRRMDFRHQKEEQHWLRYVLTKVFKNLLGWLLILAGAVMLALPGQGLLTMLLGLTLIDFPKKRELECLFVQQRQVHRAIDWIRTKANRPPLQLPGA